MKPVYKNIFTGLVGYQVRSHASGKGLGKAALGMVAARIALRSMPGALLVGGGLLAKKLYDHKKHKAPEPKQLEGPVSKAPTQKAPLKKAPTKKA